MRRYFENQISYLPYLTQDVLDRAEFKTVWSGKRMEVGDKILYAFVYVKNTDDLKFITFLEREINELEKHFRFIELKDDMIPVFRFSDDSKF